VAEQAEDPLVSKAFSADKHEELARAIQQLNPEEAQFFLEKLERAIKKRKIQITGYLAAMLIWVIGMMFALAYVGMGNGFVGWVFLAPFLGVGIILYVFGRWANHVGNPPEPK
jgi:fatty acid desaturase